MQQNYMYESTVYPQQVQNACHVPVTSPWISHDSSSSTPVSSAMYGTTATASWAHTVPTLMPWVTESSTVSTKPVVRFTAPFPPDPCSSQTATAWELLNNLGAAKMNTNLHLKRKSELDEPELNIHKQFITEDKMAAKMQNLHIGNAYTQHFRNVHYSQCERTLEESEKSTKNDKGFETMWSGSFKDGNEASKGSLVLAPELRSLVNTEKLLATTFFDKIDRNNRMAVVLWKPPHGSVEELATLRASEQKHKTGSSEHNYNLRSETNNNPDSSYIKGFFQHGPLDLPPAVPSTSAESYDSDIVMEA